VSTAESEAHGSGSNGVSDSSAADRAAFIAGELGDAKGDGKGEATAEPSKTMLTLTRAPTQTTTPILMPTSTRPTRMPMTDRRRR
jgi:hypothetical protein